MEEVSICQIFTQKLYQLLLTDNSALNHRMIFSNVFSQHSFFVLQSESRFT